MVPVGLLIQQQQLSNDAITTILQAYSQSQLALNQLVLHSAKNQIQNQRMNLPQTMGQCNPGQLKQSVDKLKQIHGGHGQTGNVLNPEL
ncbi:hypothetical protein FGO68_gene2938 [Halteria grandinella]|uniref:Uncharacterized protein n=1 Tax=Halteria grandinella TaxID=5974 RepID=A0A8J8N9B1_HALGN|nr:hypothetical protein FGO68_gene2938 [Halteria grandinella]